MDTEVCSVYPPIATDAVIDLMATRVENRVVEPLRLRFDEGRRLFRAGLAEPINLADAHKNIPAF
ncbi:hypothetical protein KCP74_10285 [Salmonella enterica subsp. enterica]|nr:hypothetical protein KCP74_10285 [Salmonella enterica subsp. enterica]